MKHEILRAIGALAVVLVPVGLAAEVRNVAPSPKPPDVASLLDKWRARNGSAWRALVDPETGWVEMLCGGASPATSTPIDDADFASLARAAVESARPLTGIDPSTLTLDGVQFLPLAEIGSTDKMTVRFVQQVGGIAVHEGSVNVLFDMRGRLLSIQAHAVPCAELIELETSSSPATAVSLAAQSFAHDERIVAEEISTPVLEVVRATDRFGIPGRLAWKIELRTQSSPDGLPAGRAIWIDVENGAVLSSERTVHTFEVRGNVRSLASPGLAPDTASNPPATTPMRFMKVTSPSGTVYTDTNGNFSFPSVNSSLAVTVTYQGSYNNVQNVAGPAFTLTQTLPPNQDNVVTMNASPTGQVTAQANVFATIDITRDFVHATNPTDTHAEFLATANCNLSQTCNAYFDGGSTNYFLPGGGCPNTAYSTVAGHENGHWFNVMYGTGNGMDGMGEGNADVWAMYEFDTPIVGLNFCGNGCNVRTGLNTRPFCGDSHPQCYGEVHADGEPWMGAAWKVRDRLNTSLGNTMGDLTANALFLGWMNAYDQTTIRSIIETQWLTLDDNDGDLNNGSPHYTDIDGAFRIQSFPGVDLHPVTIDQVTAVPDWTSERGPYGIEARAVAHNTGAAITSMSLTWRSNGSAWTTQPLVTQGGGVFGSSIPNVTSPAQVDYYVTATDSQGNSVTSPAGAPLTSMGFRVGSPSVFFHEDFDSGAVGWTHSSYGDTSNTGDDWQVGTPGGRSGTAFIGTMNINWVDPSHAISGTNCYGTDLGNNGANGSYAANAHTRLRAPVIDCSGSLGVKLRFYRWLSVQSGSNDQARILVNGNVAWANPVNQFIDENAWSFQEVDISDWADGNPSVQIDFELHTDGSTQLGGWNIDTVELTRIGPAVQSCTSATSYGPGKVLSTGGVATLSGTGDPSLLFNTFQIGVVDGPPNQFAMLYSSNAPASTPMLGGTLLIASPFAREIAWHLSSFGDQSSPYLITPAMVGTTRFYQAVFRDPQNTDGTGIGFSKALRVDFCP